MHYHEEKCFLVSKSAHCKLGLREPSMWSVMRAQCGRNSTAKNSCTSAGIKIPSKAALATVQTGFYCILCYTAPVLNSIAALSSGIVPCILHCVPSQESQSSWGAYWCRHDKVTANDKVGRFLRHSAVDCRLWRCRGHWVRNNTTVLLHIAITITATVAPCTVTRHAWRINISTYSLYSYTESTNRF